MKPDLPHNLLLTNGGRREKKFWLRQEGANFFLQFHSLKHLIHQNHPEMNQPRTSKEKQTERISTEQVQRNRKLVQKCYWACSDFSMIPVWPGQKLTRAVDRTGSGQCNQYRCTGPCSLEYTALPKWFILLHFYLVLPPRSSECCA